MYFVLARISGGGVGSSLPRSEYEGVYDLLVGFTGLFGSIARSLALGLRGVCDFGAGVICVAGGGRTSIGRAGARTLLEAAPGRGPGEAPPLGPGLGAVPAVRATDVVLVGLGFGTPVRGAGGSEARATGAAVACGAALARAIAADVGEARGRAGAGVAARAVGRSTGAGGFGDGRADGALVGAGEGATVGGTFTATETGATVGTVT